MKRKKILGNPTRQYSSGKSPIIFLTKIYGFYKASCWSADCPYHIYHEFEFSTVRGGPGSFLRTLILIICGMGNFSKLSQLFFVKSDNHIWPQLNSFCLNQTQRERKWTGLKVWNHNFHGRSFVLSALKPGCSNHKLFMI